ncbi:MAG: DotA/TraY family protein [Pseudomonadota bacterium]|nr:DotA/TraY family protein [Pseudomonadota bacterium]
MLRRLTKVVFCLLVVALSQAEQRSVDDYTFSQLQQIGENTSDTRTGGKVDVTQRIYNALTGGDPARQVAPQDLSRSYLYQIFGRIPGSFEGASQIMSVLFRIFNIGIISIASILVIYSTVFGLTTTTHDGGAMGSGRFSGWAIGRVITSIALLVPTKSGYSYAQIVVMKVVIAGIVAANTMWEASIDYINQFGSDSVFTVMPQDASAQDHAEKLLHISDNVRPTNLADQSEPYIEYALGGNTEAQGSFLVPINKAILDTVNIYKPCVPCVESPEKHKTVCASLSNIAVNVSRQGNALTLELEMQADNENFVVKGFSLEGFGSDPQSVKWKELLASYINNSARYLLSYQLNGTATQSQVAEVFASQLRILYMQIKKQPATGTEDSTDDKREQLIRKLKRGGWVQAGLYYNDLTKMNRESETQSDYFDRFPSNIVLRNYEYVVPQHTEDISKVRKTRELALEPEIAVSLAYDATLPATGSRFRGVLKDKYRLNEAVEVVNNPGRIVEAYKMLFFKTVKRAESQTLSDAMKGVYVKFKERMGLGDKYFGNGFKTEELGLLGWKIIVSPNKIAGEVSSMTTEVTDSFIKLLFPDKESLKKNPLERIGDTGVDIIKSSADFFSQSTKTLYNMITQAMWDAYALSTSFTGTKGVASAISAHFKQEAKKAREGGASAKEKDAKQNALIADLSGKAVDLGTDIVMTLIEFSQAAAKSMAGMILPLGNGLAITYITAGAFMAAYVPYIPTVVYIFSVMAWLFAVIEAMIAAPIIFIGLANPEGHDALGKSEQGVMLLLGVFLRPMLTLLGFLLALVLSYTLVELFNSLFKFTSMYYFMPMFNGYQSGDGLIYTFMGAPFILLYVYSVVVVLEQCYAMIYVIPDQILKWIGGPMDSAGASIGTALRSASTGLTQQSKMAAQGASQTSGSAFSVQTRQ